MTSPFDEIKIGSPIPTSAERLFEEIILGHIEFPKSLDEIHLNSNVKLRGVNELGLSVLNGSWTYVPTYTYPNKHALAYALSHTLIKGNYQQLINELAAKAEREFYFAPLRSLRYFLLNHDPKSGHAELKMPDLWYASLSPEGVTMQRLLEIFDAYANKHPVCKATAEMFYNGKMPAPQSDVKITFKHDHLVVLSSDTMMPQHAVDMTEIFKFILSPTRHNLNQDIFRTYRKAVNL